MHGIRHKNFNNTAQELGQALTAEPISTNPFTRVDLHERLMIEIEVTRRGLDFLDLGQGNGNDGKARGS